MKHIEVRYHFTGPALEDGALVLDRARKLESNHRTYEPREILHQRGKLNISYKNVETSL